MLLLLLRQNKLFLKYKASKETASRGVLFYFDFFVRRELGLTTKMEKSDKMRSKRNFDVAFLSGENETEDEEKEARKRQERETENTEEHRDSICKFVAIRLFSRRR